MSEPIVVSEPILIKAGSQRVLLNNRPPLVDCRVVAEDYYQQLKAKNAEIEALKDWKKKALITLLSLDYAKDYPHMDVRINCEYLEELINKPKPDGD